MPQKNPPMSELQALFSQGIHPDHRQGVGAWLKAARDRREAIADITAPPGAVVEPRAG